MNEINPFFKNKFCADDFGFSPSINDAIIELAKMDLLYSVSIAINAPFVEHRLDEILALKNKVHFFLHLNLTYGKSLTHETELSSFAIFFIDQLFFRNKKLYSLEIENQIKKAKDLNIPITGIDGHQHVHLFPSIALKLNSHNELKGLLFRKMRDLEHFQSFIASTFSNYSKEMEPFFCGYLLKKDLQNFEKFFQKCQKFNHVIIHPAKYNDFSAISFKDKLQEDRIKEFEAILKYTYER